MTTDKIKTINLLDSLPYEAPAADEMVKDVDFDDIDENVLTIEEDGQMGLNLDEV